MTSTASVYSPVLSSSEQRQSSSVPLSVHQPAPTMRVSTSQDPAGVARLGSLGQQLSDLTSRPTPLGAGAGAAAPGQPDTGSRWTFRLSLCSWPALWSSVVKLASPETPLLHRNRSLHCSRMSALEHAPLPLQLGTNSGLCGAEPGTALQGVAPVLCMMKRSPKFDVALYVSSTLLPACRIGTSHQRTALQVLQLLVFLLSSGGVGAPQQVSGRCPALPCPALPCPALPCPALPCPHPLVFPALWIWHPTDVSVPVGLHVPLRCHLGVVVSQVTAGAHCSDPSSRVQL